MIALPHAAYGMIDVNTFGVMPVVIQVVQEGAQLQKPNASWSRTKKGGEKGKAQIEGCTAGRTRIAPYAQ